MTLITRRSFTSHLGLALIGVRLGCFINSSQAAPVGSETFEQALDRIEAHSGGRLGVAVLDTASGSRLAHRENERFPLCSTFKVLAAGAVLKQVDAGQTQLEHRVRFVASDVVANSPITKDKTGGEGMTLAELCAAAIDYSDNTAGNMLLKQIGGPAGLTSFARSLGDTVTRLDRFETALNESLPGDPQDTTTPAAMVANLNSLVFGTSLSPTSRGQLVGWLKGNTTGGTRLRAGLPPDCVVGDKTGAGDRGSTNDLAVIWPVSRKPILIAAYLTGTDASVDARNTTIASVARAVSDLLSP